MVLFCLYSFPSTLPTVAAGSGGPSAALAAAFWRLVCSGGQLDLVELLYNKDGHTGQDTLELLLREVMKAEVITEEDLQDIMKQRSVRQPAGHHETEVSKATGRTS